MVFQSYALWPHMTVAQNIGYGLKLRHVGRTEIGARINELLAMLRLDGLGERKVTALSGGQRQRVALGRALAISPQVLLLDEPLSNLDARIREDVRHEIKTLQQRLGITTVHVTHDRQEAMVMADRIVILNAGHIAQIGDLQSAGLAVCRQLYGRGKYRAAASGPCARHAAPRSSLGHGGLRAEGLCMRRDRREPDRARNLAERSVVAALMPHRGIL